jgi:hypothetical protein
MEIAMQLLWQIVALVLLSGQDDNQAYWRPSHELLAAVQNIAIEQQLMDVREKRYFLAAPEDFAGDLRLLRMRYQDLQNCPRIEDAERFPSRETVSEMLAFNRAYRTEMTKQESFDVVHQDLYHEAVVEADLLYKIWDEVRDAQCDYYYVTVRRLALKHLKSKLGEADYYAGRMPPYVPIWRFSSRD